MRHNKSQHCGAGKQAKVVLAHQRDGDTTESGILAGRAAKPAKASVANVPRETEMNSRRRFVGGVDVLSRYQARSAVSRSVQDALSRSASSRWDASLLSISDADDGNVSGRLGVQPWSKVPPPKAGGGCVPLMPSTAMSALGDDRLDSSGAAVPILNQLAKQCIGIAGAIASSRPVSSAGPRICGICFSKARYCCSQCPGKHGHVCSSACLAVHQVTRCNKHVR